MTLNKEQRKYLAGAIEKLSIAYFAVFGYTWFTKGDWTSVAHAVFVYTALQVWSLAVLAGVKESGNGQS